MLERPLNRRFKTSASAPGPRALAGVVVAALVLVHLSAEQALLRVERDGDRLRLSAPQLHFLTGEPLDRLRDGRSVTYVLSAWVVADHADPRSRVTRRVVFSYDLWEERFSAADLDSPKTSASHLSSAAAEAWSVDLLRLPARDVPADKTFVVKFECWLRDGSEPAADAPSATTLTGLIDLLSRTSRGSSPRWEALSPRVRLSDLKERPPK